MTEFRKNDKGLTLIEVLVALIILSIALTAVIKSVSQNIRHSYYLQNRTIATWIGSDVMNNIRLGILKIPGTPDHLSQENKTLGQAWVVDAMMNITPNPRIKKIIIDVYHQPEHSKLTHLESYLYVPQ